MKNLDELCINTIRMLAVDQIEAANSGHPGMPLGAAPMTYVLWDRFLRHDPKNLNWFDRDRFILSAGHGSSLLYALLHMTGYDLPLDELKRFRQWGSKTPGHPEYGVTPGVEVTTGPLGQGFAMGVGMAIAEAHLAAVFNRPGYPVVNHRTYTVVSDGDLMEGIASEAASLAGHLGLGKMVYLYDDNKISIEGSTDITFTEDVETRFKAYGWQVLRVDNGNDAEAIDRAISEACAESRKPSLIIVRTHIGYGSPKQDSADSHGAPLGPDACAATKESLGWPVDKPFHVPPEARAHMGRVRDKGQHACAAWVQLMEGYRKAYPIEAEKLNTLIRGELPAGWDKGLPTFKPEDGPVATRAVSGTVLNALASRLLTMIGGSADLAPSNKSVIKDSPDFQRDSRHGRNIRFGVREHAMAAAVNGMALHGGVIPYGATFLIFSDYARPSLRLAALMGAPSIFIFSHDSIGVGEDGPTHQPIDQLLSLRAIPDFTLLRPADANETVAAWRIAIESKGPVALALTRQKLPVLDPDTRDIDGGVRQGAYILEESDKATPDLVFAASGSEVSLAIEARNRLGEKGVSARVVSVPSWELFEEQDEDYKKTVLPPGVPRMILEAASAKGWGRYAGGEGMVVGLDRFGASAPGGELMKHLGFEPEAITEMALGFLKKL